MYWRIRNRLRDTYIKLKYGKKPVRVYYDKLTEQYVIPKYLDLTCYSVEMLLSDVVRDGLVYPFVVGGDTTHEHEFKNVMQSAYEWGDDFTVGGHSEYYSEQQLRLLEKLAKQGGENK